MNEAVVRQPAPQADTELGMRRLAAVAELGQRALANRDLPELMDDAVSLAARTLEVDFASVLKVLPNGRDFLHVAGTGWPDGVVGYSIVPGGLCSQAGYTLVSGTSVVLEDLRSERRFQANSWLHEQGIISGVSVLIPAPERAFGIMSLHTRSLRHFTAEDVHFLEAMANVLASAIERRAVDARLRETEAQYRSIFESTSDGMVIVDLQGVIVELNPAYCRMLGYEHDELIGRQFNTLYHPDQQRLAADSFAAVLDGDTVHTRAILAHKDGSRVHVAGHGTRLTFLGRPHLLGVARDVREQVQAYELLEQRVAERTRELSAIVEVSHKLASTLELTPLLGQILEQLKLVLDYTGAAIFIVEDEHVRVLDYRGPLPPAQMINLRIPLAEALGYKAVLLQRGPVIVDDRWSEHPLAGTLGDVYGYFRSMLGYVQSVLVVPLMVQERPFGVVRIDHAMPRAYSAHHASLAMAFATHAAVAIENARLYAQAHEAAAMEERYRLARELHDSVTQALYGVTMYAEAAAATLAGGDQATATHYLQVLRDTAQDALREMRLLIFELRPPVLEQQGLVAALHERLAAVEGRVGGVTTRLDVVGEPQLPPTIEQALYGIAQEALNNVFKHAKARTIVLTLRQDASTVLLEIADDGIGFDPASLPGAGGLGVRGMSERAAHVGARLVVRSAPGQGTTVRVEVAL